LSRSSIAKTLQKIIVDGRSLSKCSTELNKTIVNARQQAFCKACIYGVLRNYFSLSEDLSNLIKTPLRSKDSDVRMLILSALYQVKFMNTPPHALVSENVEAARSLKKEWACKLVNAVLRRYLKNNKLNIPHTESHSTFNHPPWLVNLTRQDWPNDWENILVANNAHPPLTLRINRQRITRDGYLEVLARADIMAISTHHSPDGVIITKPIPIESLPGFKDGHFSVQDEAAQLSRLVMGIDTSGSILDACAAPGGKTTHILEYLSEQNSLLAVDCDQDRMDRLNDNLVRLGITCETLIADSSQLNSIPYNNFKFILLDGPCSASGVIRRHPDIRFHRRAEDIARLAKAQLTLLDSMWHLLENEGKLLYVTCSIFKAENDDVIGAFLKKNSNAQISNQDFPWGTKTKYGRQTLPGVSDMDGFYFCLIKKKRNICRV
jgi:16S rRNA (cytosine967-C5)-methyltransferase